MNLKKRIATLEGLSPRVSPRQGRAFHQVVSALCRELGTTDWIGCANRIATGTTTPADQRAIDAVSPSDVATLGCSLESLFAQVARIDAQY